MNPFDKTIRELIMEKAELKKYEIDDFIKLPDDLNVRAFIVNTNDLGVPPEQLRYVNSKVLICRHLSAVHKKKENLNHYVDLVWYSDFVDPDIKVWVKIDELCQIFYLDEGLTLDEGVMKELMYFDEYACLFIDNDVYLEWSEIQSEFACNAKNGANFS